MNKTCANAAILNKHSEGSCSQCPTSFKELFAIGINWERKSQFSVSVYNPC